MAKKLMSFRIDADAWQQIKRNAKQGRVTIGDYMAALDAVAQSRPDVFAETIRKARNMHFLELAYDQLSQMTGISDEEKVRILEGFKRRIK
jgi:hypothetical protein